MSKTACSHKKSSSMEGKDLQEDVSYKTTTNSNSKKNEANDKRVRSSK